MRLVLEADKSLQTSEKPKKTDKYSRLQKRNRIKRQVQDKVAEVGRTLIVLCGNRRKYILFRKKVCNVSVLLLMSI